MAPKFFSKIIVSILIVGLFLAVLPAPVSAAPSTKETIKEHTIKFYLDPALVPDMESAKVNLAKYVADMNTILAKNTNRRLVFDPQTGIILTTKKPQTDSAPSPLPNDNFAIWAHATFTGNPYSYGGYSGLDFSGAGVLAGLKWTRIYNPESLSGTGLQDYCVQINNMLHELAHVFGAGIGEYYNLAQITDTTNVKPLLDIDLSNPDDMFWSEKPDFSTDPLLRLTRSASRADYLAAVRFSDLTAAVLNGSYRNGISTFTQYTVQVLDESGQPVAGANVKVWNIVGGVFPNESELLNDVVTDENGQVELAWGGLGYPHNSSNFLRLIKIFRAGVAVAEPRYISVFDADSAKLVRGDETYTITFQLKPGPQTVTFTSAAALDGFLLEKEAKTNVGGSLNAGASAFRLGDDARNRQYKTVLSFDTSSLPEDALITSVTLKIRQSGAITGTNPFNTVGNALVDIRKGAFGSAKALALNDFNATATLTKVAAFGKSATNGWYSARLNANGLNNINKAGVTQFRLYFARTDSNSRADFISFVSGNGANNAPQLLVTYTLP